MIRRLLCSTLISAWAALIAGCTSHEPATRYFVLTPGASAATANGAGGPRIFIRRVDIPGYLQSTKVATRRTDNQIEYAPTAQWAEPLPEGVAHAVEHALNGSAHATVVGVIGGGIPPARDYDLKIDLDRFEGDDHGDVILVATWTLFAPESATPVATHRSRFVQTGWKYGDYPALAKLLGLDLSALGADIAHHLRS